MPLVSVLIPCREERDFISACLKSVQGFVLPEGWRIEVLVIDAGSTDGTRELVEEIVAADKRFRLVHNARGIQSSALNLGIALSKGEYLMRLDAHSNYPQEYLLKCVETSLRTGADNVGGRVQTRARGGYGGEMVQALTTHWFGVGSSFRTGAREGPADTVPYGFFPRDVFRRFGFFDERLARGQDYEFNRRITARGGVVWLNPDIVLDYFQQPSLRSFLKKQFTRDAPYNAYMWYLAPYTFTPRHAVTAAFAAGLTTGMALALVYRWVAVLLGILVLLYCGLALWASIRQALRYRRLRHAILLPAAFLAYHFVHGLGVLHGLLRIMLGLHPVRRRDAAWVTTTIA